MSLVNPLQPPNGWLRLGLRLPIWLYRLHLGWVLGNRFLLLTHVGRISGQPRQTVIEVVDYDSGNDTYFVVSGWGTKADWYRNLLVNPQVTLNVGWRKLSVTAQVVPLPQAITILEDYTYRSPRAFKELTGLFLGQQLPPGRQSSQTLAERMPMIAFRPRSN